MCTISFKVFVTILLYALDFWPRGMWDPSSPTRNGTCAPLQWEVKSWPKDCQGSPPAHLKKISPLFTSLILPLGLHCCAQAFLYVAFLNAVAPRCRAWALGARVPTSCGTRLSLALWHVGSSPTRDRILRPLHQQEDSYLLYHQLILTLTLSRRPDNQTGAVGWLQPDPGQGPKRSLFFFWSRGEQRVWYESSLFNSRLQAGLWTPSSAVLHVTAWTGRAGKPSCLPGILGASIMLWALLEKGRKRCQLFNW